MPHTVPNVYVIDDDMDDNEMLSTALEEEGMKTNSFNTGEKAIAHLKDSTELPTMIILDYNMPRLNGEQTIRIIKSNPETSSIPVVIFSTHLTDLFKEDLMKLGAHNCFEKPLSYNNFLGQVSIFKDLITSLQFNTHKQSQLCS
jgi:CheY-like chemotaxis protein